MKKEEYIERVEAIATALSLATKLGKSLERDLKKEMENNFSLMNAWACVSTTQSEVKVVLKHAEEALIQYKDDRKSV